MFIELTDHLRCPRDHPEGFLVLLPETMVARRVREGHLGCPACGWGAEWKDGIPDFGGGWRSTQVPSFGAAAVHAFLGLEGPGGWIALAGSAGAIAMDVSALLPGVGIVAINPPANVESVEQVNVLVSGAWPLKARSMRGVVLGADAIKWQRAAIGSALPGRRVVGEGEPPNEPGVALLGSADGVWVAQAAPA